MTFIKVHRRRLNAAFGLHWRRAPAHTSIRYILQGLEPQAVEQISREHAAGLCSAITDPARRVIAIDGKTLRQASTISPIARRPRRCTPSTSKPVVLAHVHIQESSTKSPPRSSGSANSMSRTASLPLMPCIAKKNLRGRRTGAGSPHRPTEGQSALAVAESQPPALPSGPSAATPQSAPANRHETRSADVFSATRSVAATEWKSLIKSIVRVTREVLHRDAKTGLWSSTSEVAYYLANSAVSACLAATAIRHHWNVENTLHYTCDVTFQEDQSRIPSRRNPGVFVRLRSFAYNG